MSAGRSTSKIGSFTDADAGQMHFYLNYATTALGKGVSRTRPSD